MYAASDNPVSDNGAATMAIDGAATDIEAIGRLVRQRTLDAVAMHFAAMAEQAPGHHEAKHSAWAAALTERNGR